MAEDYRMTAVDEKGRRIYTDTGEYIPLWKREGRSPNAQAKKPSGGGAGAGLAGLAAMVGGRYLATHIPGWISGAGSTAAEGAGGFFGSGGATAAQQAAIDSLGGDIGGVSSLSGSGSATSAGTGGSAAGSFLADTLPTIGSYAVPTLAAAALGYGLSKQYGKPRSRREANNWGRFVADTGYKYLPEDWATRDTNPDPTAEDLVGSSAPARYFGNAWMEKFSPEERTSIMQGVLDAGNVNERRGGYDIDKKLMASLADEVLAAKGESPWASARMAEVDEREAAKRNFMYGTSGDHSNLTLRNAIQAGLYSPQGKDNNAFKVGADWMPQSYLDAIAKLKEQV